ncbi:hypothetical protein SAMN05660642_03061 [Geodermatophilus siccatus]|uniref:Uncharacterized protein n=1 Tax=Geodermatophilus siccatus TaxID=1137991 RepID=A0A1G9V3N4_9ACTN|nr:hypothetical protein [Geodermatophilus siccatus]SDM66445.1 hypothetical protein SAMN05660642_03061 [Geodermatophilus siccatus]
MVQLLGVVVPLLVAALPLIRWPTLQRRVRGHVALVKELPEGMGKDFRAAVEEELAELAHCTRSRSERRSENIEKAVRAGIVLFMLALGTAPQLLIEESDLTFTGTLKAAVAVLVIGTSIALAVLFVWFVWWASGRYFRYRKWIAKRERLHKQAQAEGKVVRLIDGDHVLADPNDPWPQRSPELAVVARDVVDGRRGALVTKETSGRSGGA